MTTTATGIYDLPADELLPAVAHDLRSPLASVLGFLELALDNPAYPLLPQQRRYIELAQTEARRALRISDDLLTASALRHGVTLDLDEVDLAALIAERVVAAQHRAAARSISLSADEETLSIALADRHRLGQLLDNLINNAVAYTPAGGDVVVSSGRGHGGGWIAVAVADNGSGIAPEFRDRLFQPFTRAVVSGGARSGGAGLGLSIVRSIAEAHGATADVESAVGLGTVFLVEGLALAEAAVGRTALVVEDSATARAIAGRVLQDAGYAVLAAATPAAALQLVGAFAGRVDLVVSDLILPGMDGLQLLRLIRETRPGIHCVLCSATLPDQELLGGLGVTSLGKPFTRDQLLAAAGAAA